MMTEIIANLRECLKLQRVGEGACILQTAFGRALLDNGNLDAAGLSAHDRYTMLYWIALPSYGEYYSFEYDDYQWGQRVLLYHGRKGFSLTWKPKSLAS